MKSEMIRIAIVDDQAIFRQSLRTVLEKESGLSVVAEAENGLAGIELVEEHKPDIVLMDLSMPGMDSFQATRIITSRYPDTKVIILSMHSDDRLKAISCQAGACYHLCKGECSPKEIIAAIRDGHHSG
jgi:two-component system, NarL family, response regulator DegU